MKVSLLFLLGIAATGNAYGQEPPGSVRLQIVNATNFRAISLRINGVEVYPEFPQGQQTGDASLDAQQVVYQVSEQKTGGLWKSQRITYSPHTAQTLVIVGDFPHRAPGLFRPTKPGETPPSEILFFVLPHAVGPSEKPFRLRVINGLPRQTLSFSDANGKSRALGPGQMETFGNQPPVFVYQPRVENETIPILMRQDEKARNALIIFFLRDGKPDFMRVFENP